MKKDDTNVKTITRDTRDLTPFEKRAKALEDGAYMMKIYQETSTLIEKLEEIKTLEAELPVPLELLEKMADEAIIGLATDLEERYGICA